MGKPGRRIWYAIAIFLSGLILLLSALGIAGVWITQRVLADTVVQVLDAVGNVTESLRQAAQGIDQKLERMESASSFISTASARLSQNVTDQGLIMLLLPEEEQQNLTALALSGKETAGTIRDTLSAGLTIYRSIDGLPFVNLPTPSQDQVDRMGVSVAEVQSAADSLSTEITSFRSGVSERIFKVEALADRLTSRLEESRDQLANLDTRLAITQENLVQLQETVERALVLGSILVTLLLAWVIYTQVEVLRLYVQRWKAVGSKTGMEEPPDQTIGGQAEAVIEPELSMPENSDVTKTSD